MQFKHPELLYALLLLIIPVIVHLFQLRKFQKENFTNVAFLKQISIQTRKSNTIKKWLILLTRLGVIAMIVLAFAQPFLTQSDSATREKETVVYIDNSFSMQAKGASGQLLKQALQDVVTNIPEEEVFTIITNTDTYKNISIKDARNNILQIPYTSEQLSAKGISLKAQKEFSKNPASEKRLIMISDFQDTGEQYSIDHENMALYYVQTKPVVENNITIDSLYPIGGDVGKIKLTAQLSTQENQDTNIPVSLYNGEQLMAKATASFDNNLETEVTFEIKNNTDFKGSVTIEDPLLSFDNTLYFNSNTTRPIKVLSINEHSNSEFLSRIYTMPEFEYTATAINDLDYSKIPNYNFIILNEVTTPSQALANALATFSDKGGSVLCILSEDGDRQSYINILSKLGNIQLGETVASPKLVTNINYDHPIYANVFDNRIKNFQYPSIENTFALRNGDPVLSFEDGSHFITTKNSIYVTAGGINTKNSNFKNSPLIVPTLYNMAKQSLALPRLYFTNGISTQYDIPISLQEDAILSLARDQNPSDIHIPLQRTFGNKVTITTGTQPEEAGIYNVVYKDSTLQQVSYNYSRSESILRYQTIQPKEGANYHTSVVNLFDSLKDSDRIQSLWKWFVIFALIFLLLEILIIKYFK